MFKIDSNTKQISITRGDVASIDVTATNETNGNHIFNVGDIVRFNVIKKKECNCIVLSKEVVVEEETTSVKINLTSQDTKIGEVINKPVEYWYEIEINPETECNTIIGYDESGAKIFKLYPEGGAE